MPFLCRTSLWRKILILFIIVVLALSLNSSRIGILLWVANTYGENGASPESYFHDGSGALFFEIGFVAMALLVRKIDRQKNT